MPNILFKLLLFAIAVGVALPIAPDHVYRLAAIIAIQWLMQHSRFEKVTIEDDDDSPDGD